VEGDAETLLYVWTARHRLPGAQLKADPLRAGLSALCRSRRRRTAENAARTAGVRAVRVRAAGPLPAGQPARKRAPHTMRQDQCLMSLPKGTRVTGRFWRGELESSSSSTPRERKSFLSAAGDPGLASCRAPGSAGLHTVQAQKTFSAKH
jgi:hypothetical protein